MKEGGNPQNVFACSYFILLRFLLLWQERKSEATGTTVATSFNFHGTIAKNCGVRDEDGRDKIGAERWENKRGKRTLIDLNYKHLFYR